MKKLVTRLGLLLGCALSLVLTAGTGTAGADVDDIFTLYNPVTITLDVPPPWCTIRFGCTVDDTNICIGAGQRFQLGVDACMGIGDS